MDPKLNIEPSLDIFQTLQLWFRRADISFYRHVKLGVICIKTVAKAMFFVFFFLNQAHGKKVERKNDWPRLCVWQMKGLNLPEPLYSSTFDSHMVFSCLFFLNYITISFLVFKCIKSSSSKRSLRNLQSADSVL